MTTARSLLTGSTPLKLEYFNIEGVAEPVRLALSVASIPFDDVRIAFEEWQSKKPTTKHGVLPEMTLPSGEVVTDSMAMLRLVGEADEEDKLYPSEVTKRLKIEQVLGLVGDLTRAWSPSLYLSMRPGRFGYPADWSGEEKDKVVKAVREAFVSEDLPKFMGHFEELVKESGDGFLTGEDLTIADLSAFQQVSFMLMKAKLRFEIESLIHCCNF
jgi:glutathione S-transferase